MKRYFPPFVLVLLLLPYYTYTQPTHSPKAKSLTFYPFFMEPEKRGYLEPYEVDNKEEVAYFVNLLKTVMSQPNEEKAFIPNKEMGFIYLQLVYRGNHPTRLIQFSRVQSISTKEDISFRQLLPDTSQWFMLKKAQAIEVCKWFHYQEEKWEAGPIIVSRHLPYNAQLEGQLVSEFERIFSEPMIPEAAYAQDSAIQRAILIRALKQYHEFYVESYFYPKLRPLIKAEVTKTALTFSNKGIPFRLQNARMRPKVNESYSLIYVTPADCRYVLTHCDYSIWEQIELGLHPDLEEAFNEALEE